MRVWRGHEKFEGIGEGSEGDDRIGEKVERVCVCVCSGRLLGHHQM